MKLWSRKGTVLFALLWFGSWLVLNGLVLVQRRILSDFCTDQHAKDILHNLCVDFSSGLVSGDMCLDLCVLKQVQYQRCLYYENGKKVLQAQWRDRLIILKSKHENFSSYEPLNTLQDQDAADELSPLDVVYYATLEVRNSLGLTLEEEDEEALSANISLNNNPNIHPNKVNTEHIKANPERANLSGSRLKAPSLDQSRLYSRAELSSLWALLQQEEYTFLRVLQDLSPHVARVLGSCGHFYAVEFLSAGHAWDQNIFSLDDSPPQTPPPARYSRHGNGLNEGRGGRDHRIALSFMDLVWTFSRDFTHKLHLCDIKPENFAIRQDLTVVAIDVDMAFFEPKMREILEQNCSSDEDCSFFDCSSRCSPETHRCSPQRSNSNLQVICEKIFRPWFSPSLLGAKAGLPLQVELQRAVQECSETESDQTGGSRDVHQRLINVLTRLIEEGGASDEQHGGVREDGHTHTALNF